MFPRIYGQQQQSQVHFEYQYPSHFPLHTDFTTNTYWNVAGLSPGFTYNWRVVAVTTQQTSSTTQSFVCAVLQEAIT